MDVERAKKSRSIGSESKSSPQLKSPRPELGERVQSAPALERQRRESESKQSQRSSRTSSASTSQTKQSQRSSRTSTTASVRTSKTSSRDVLAPSRSHDSAAAVSRRPSHPSCEEVVTTRPRTSSRVPGCSQITVAVLSAARAGKTVFIQKALDLRKPPSSPVSYNKMSLEDFVYKVGLVEFSLDEVDFSNGRRVSWPKHVNGELLPPIDGVLCLYDVTDQESIAEIPALLGAFSNSNLPCVLVPCKCDRPLQERQVDSRFNTQISTAFPSIQIGPTSATNPDSQKRCMMSILKIIIANSRESSRHTSPHTTRPRAATDFGKSTSRSKSPGDSLSVHSRSKSELPRSRSREARPPSAFLAEQGLTEESDEDDYEDAPFPRALMIDTRATTQRIPRSGSHTPMTSSGFLNELVSASDDQGSETPQTPESLYMTSVLRPGTAHTADSQMHNTFLNMSEDESPVSPETQKAGGITELGRLKLSDDSSQEMAVSFDDLVDRLLLLPHTQRELKFVPIFLALYRAFATPTQLLTSIIARFESVEKSKSAQLTRVGSQLRYLQVLGDWTAQYPGDFASLALRSLASSFVARIGKSRNFAGAAKEISNNLDVNATDDDAEWAYSGLPVTTKAKSVSTGSSGSTAKTSPEKSRPSKAPILADDSDDDSDASDHPHDLDSSPRHSGAPSTASSLVRTANTSSQSLANLLNLAEARENAKRIRPIAQIPLGKLQWHQFMDTPAENFAIEVTRTDWTMYTAIRPRDFIRHVCISGERRRKSIQTDNIGMMVKHFNHLALFVSGMILLRDKPKHRAKALERFMAIAWKVRQMNNYNSLGAIVAGITGPEIQRLSMTKELVPPSVQKDFLRLTILMSHSRSHTAYRMAWENSFAERIPFLPLVRQDLTRAETGNRTFVGANGDKIHWRKFEIMGEVILGIQKSQEQHYEFPVKNQEIARLILETKVLEGSEESADPRDELQKRSEMLESVGGMGGGGGEGGNRKKFNDWFRR